MHIQKHLTRLNDVSHRDRALPERKYNQSKTFFASRLFRPRALASSGIETSHLQLRSWCLQSRHHYVSDITGRFIEEEGHAVRAEALANNVELYAVLVDHICNSAVVVSLFPGASSGV